MGTWSTSGIYIPDYDETDYQTNYATGVTNLETALAARLILRGTASDAAANLQSGNAGLTGTFLPALLGVGLGAGTLPGTGVTAEVRGTGTHLRLSRSSSVYTDLITDVNGDLWVDASGDDVNFNDRVIFLNPSAPVVSAKAGPSTSQQHTIPAVASDTFALLSADQTFANKTLTSAVLNTPIISGGTINNSVIGGSTPVAGTFTVLTANTRTVTPTVGANGTQQHTLPAVASDTVALLAASQTLTNKAITGGSINNTPIGSTTPSTGAFTTLSATTSVTTPSLLSAANLTLSPNGGAGSVLPPAPYSVTFGALTSRFLALYAAELNVSTLVAASVLATLGGRVLVGPTTTLIADLTAVATTIDVKHNNLASGDRALLEGGGQVEFLAVTSGATPITGGYRYSVTRNLDTSGANTWSAGDAVFNTGTTGKGWLDLYSSSGVLGTGTGPALVVNRRTGTTYNAYSAVTAAGNLNGLYGYVADTYGFAAGDYAGGSYLTVEATNGVRLYNVGIALKNGSNTTVSISATGNTLIGTSVGNLASATPTLLALPTGATVNSEVLAAGSLLIGSNAASNANLLFDPATGRLNFRSGSGTPAAYVSATTGALTAGAGGVVLDANGILLNNATTGYTQTGALNMTASGTTYGYLTTYLPSAGNVAGLWRVQIPASGTSASASIYTNTVSAGQSYDAQIYLVSGTAATWGYIRPVANSTSFAFGVGLHSSAPSATLHVLNTVEQLRLGYDTTYDTRFTVNSVGNLTVTPYGGAITFSGQPHVVYTTTGTTSVANGGASDTQIVWNSAITSNANITLSSGTFTVAVAGKYLVIVKAYWNTAAGAAGMRYLKIKNGAGGQLAFHALPVPGGYDSSNEISDVFDLAANATLAAWVYQTAGTGQTVQAGASYTSMTIIKVA